MFVIAGASGKTGRVIADTLLPEDPAVAEFHAHRRRMIDAMAAAIRARRVPHVVFLSAAAAVLPDGNGCRKGR